MRLAGQVKAGFYPADPAAVEAACKFLAPPADGPFNVLDPCAGQGAALAQIVGRFGGKEFKRGGREAVGWGIELDGGRAGEVLQVNDPKRTLAPADCFNCRISAGSMQLVWLNPPYDQELGGGNREEHKFLLHCHSWLCVGGVMMFVVPERIIGANSPSLRFFAERYEQVGVMYFPPEVRKYNEVVLFGVKSKVLRVVPAPKGWNQPAVPVPPVLGPLKHKSYAVPCSKGSPKTFEKAGLTAEEIGVALTKSPLRKYLRPTAPLPLARPPLPLFKGHMALLLSAGHLNGVVKPEGEEPHVIRGVCKKEKFVKEDSTEVREDGAEVRRVVEAERFVLKVRAVTPDGKFHDLT